MKVIAGLGNPGAEYEKTRHNTGFIAIDALASKYGIKKRRAADLERVTAALKQKWGEDYEEKLEEYRENPDKFKNVVSSIIEDFGNDEEADKVRESWDRLTKEGSHGLGITSTGLVESIAATGNANGEAGIRELVIDKMNNEKKGSSQDETVKLLDLIYKLLLRRGV